MAQRDQHLSVCLVRHDGSLLSFCDCCIICNYQLVLQLQLLHHILCSQTCESQQMAVWQKEPSGLCWPDEANKTAV